MRTIATLVALALGTTAEAQLSWVERIRQTAVADDAARLHATVRERPDDARELVRLLLIEAGSATGTGAHARLAIARRVGVAYARAWEDSFPLLQVERFAATSPAWRAAKLAADSTRRAGNEAHQASDAPAAIVIWRDALRRAAAIDDSAGMAAALGNIGTAFRELSEPDSADRYLERAGSIAERAGDRRTAANALGASGALAHEQGDLVRARTLHARALELRSRIGDARGTAADHNNLGLIALELGELGAARTHHQLALTIARQHALDEPAAAALLNLGNVASIEADYAEADRHYREALALFREMGRDADVALALHNLGLLALRRGDYRGALARLGAARVVFARIDEPADLALVERDLAAVATAMGDLRGAEAHLRRAEQMLARAGGGPGLAAPVALARADLAMYVNDFVEAEQQYRRAETRFGEAGDEAGRSEAQQGLAMLLIEQRRYVPALELLRSIARVQAGAGDRRPAALTQLVIGDAQHRRGDLAGARATFQTAIDSFMAIADPVGEAAALGALADLELDAGVPLAAEGLYRRALARVRQRPSPAVSWRLHAGLGRALERRGALAEAARELRTAIDHAERVAATLPAEDRRTTFLADKWNAYALLATVEHARGDDASAFTLSERLRARQMLDLLARGRLTAPAASDSTLVEREQDLRRRIAELTRRLEGDDPSPAARRGPLGEVDGPVEVSREALVRAQSEYARLLVELRERASPHGAVVRIEPASWRDAARLLESDEALIEYLVADSTTLAFVVRSDTLHVVDLRIGRRALESAVDFVRGTLVRPDASRGAPPAQPAWRAPLRRLHAQLVAPLERANTLAGVRRLIVVPHAELHYLPFAALVRADSSGAGADSFLIERYDIELAPSASVWIRLGERARHATSDSGNDGRVLAVAPRTSALPGSRAEVEAIRAMYGASATVLLDDAATEAALRAEAGRHGIVHLATYGVLNKHNPLFSHVSLNAGASEDGRLEVHEVFGLALDARLVVLSACQTGLGSGTAADVPAGDDWVGLVRAFLGAGARNVIATLWPVEDRSTARLMESLHRELRSGRPESAALAAAQRGALRDPATADPFYWAGFVLVGGR